MATGQRDKILFAVDTTYDHATIQTFQRLLNHTIRRGRIRLVRAVAFLLSGAGLLCGLLWLWSGVAVVPVVSGFLMCLVFLAAGLFYERLLSGRGAAATGLTVRYTFDVGGYTTHMGGKDTRSSYGIIRALCQGEGCCAVMLNRHRGFLLPYAHVTGGSAEELARFLSRQTGLALQTPCL